MSLIETGGRLQIFLGTPHCRRPTESRDEIKQRTRVFTFSQER